MKNVEKQSLPRLKLEAMKINLRTVVATTTGGLKCTLYGILCDIQGTHQYFEGILTAIKNNIYHCDALDYDYDVDYSEWGSDKHLNLIIDSTNRMPKGTGLCTDISGMKNNITDFLNSISEEELLQQVQVHIDAFKALLREIHVSLQNFHPDLSNGKVLFLELQNQFEQEHGAEAMDNFTAWKDNLDNEDAVVKSHLQGKSMKEMLTMFNSGVLNVKFRTQDEVDTGQYQSEIDAMQTSLIPKDMDFNRLYSALRELTDYTGGVLIPKMHSLGNYFYYHRKEINHRMRNSFLYYLYMMKLIIQEGEKKVTEVDEELNYFAPSHNLKVKYLPLCLPIMKANYGQPFIDRFVNQLMSSDLKDRIATDWTVPHKRMRILADILSVFIDCGVLKSNRTKIAELYPCSDIKVSTFAKYIGQGRNSEIAEWAQTCFRK